MIILNVTKRQGFNFSVKDATLEKPQGNQINPSAFLLLMGVNKLEHWLCYYLLQTTIYWLGTKLLVQLQKKLIY